MNLTRRSFLGALLATGVVLLIDEEGEAIGLPEPAQDELVAMVALIFRAQDRRDYIASAGAALKVGEVWRQTIELSNAICLERVIIPSAIAPRLELRVMRVDALDMFVGPLPAEYFSEVAHFGEDGFAPKIGAVAKARVEFEIARIS